MSRFPPSSESAPSTGALLRRYVAGDAPAFRDLVQRFYPLVLSAALRRSGGQHALAEDAAQMVFIDLAKRAPGLRADERLGGWLHQRAVRAARDLMRGEQRRREREEASVLAEDRPYSLTEDGPSAWRDLAPHVDEALTKLSGTDREAVLLRFVENRDFRAVGEALGMSDDAAQKRVSRALEKLRGLLPQRSAVPAAAAVLGSGFLADSSAAATMADLSGIAGRLSSATLTKTGALSAFARWLPQWKAAAAGSALACTAWSWPLMREYQASHAAISGIQPDAQPVGGGTHGGVRFPVFPAPPKMEPGLSVEEIVKRIGALAAGPRLPSSSQAFHFFCQQLEAGNRSGEALRLITRTFPQALLNTMDRYSWRETLIEQWGKIAPFAAMDYTLANPPVPSPHGSGEVSILGSILREAGNLHAAELSRWLAGRLASSLIDGGTRLGKQTIYSLSRNALNLALTQKSTEALMILSVAENKYRLGILADADDSIKDLESLRLLWEVVPTLESPKLRDNLMQGVIRRLGSLDRRLAEEHVEAMTDPSQRLKYAGLVAAPPVLIPVETGVPLSQESRKPRVDWWLSMASTELHDTTAIQIASVWDQIDPEWSDAWLRRQLSPEAYAVALVTRFKNLAGWESSEMHAKKENFAKLQKLADRLQRVAPEKTAAAFAELRKQYLPFEGVRLSKEQEKVLSLQQP